MVVIIPTCNRSAAINTFLHKCAWDLKWYGIDIVIYDSSKDRRTCAIVTNFKLDNCSNVFYHNCETDDEDINEDKRIVSAYNSYVNKYDYIWLIPDDFILTFDRCYSEILKFIKKKMDVIVVDAVYRNRNKSFYKIYEDNFQVQKLFREEFLRMAIFGTIIFSNRFLKELLKLYPADQIGFSFWQSFALFHYLADRKAKIAVLVGDVFYRDGEFPKKNDLIDARKFFEKWADNWYRMISGLPVLYDYDKKEVLKIDAVGFRPFNLKALIRMRAIGGLNLKVIQRYKMYLPYVSKISVAKFYIAALLPKFVSKMMILNQHKKTMRFITKVYTDLNKMMP